MVRTDRLRPIVVRVVAVLLLSTLLSIGLFMARVVVTGSMRFDFMLWNLFLGWLPLFFALWLQRRLGHSLWFGWQNLLLTGAWLGFLPNSFYLITDLIHLNNTGEIMKLYDAVMMMSFIMNGLVLGYASVYVLHIELLQRVRRRWAHTFIGLVFLSCGFAIYLGRYLRWNTWDILLNPFGLLFDVSDRFVNPVVHSETFVVTLTFFGLLASFYAVIYQLAGLLRQQAKR